jgi:hypothetical protein
MENHGLPFKFAPEQVILGPHIFYKGKHMIASRELEPLEPRTLMSASFNLVSLLGYNRLGSSWTYSVSDTDVIDGKTHSGSGTATVGVSSKNATIGGVKSDLVTLAIGKLKLSAGWYTTSKGVFIDFSTESTSLGNISVSLNNTGVGPAAMVVGKTYTGKGTFSGSFSGTFKGQAYTATISGSDTISGELVGTKTVHVTAGTFTNAVQGNYTANISGKLVVKVAGRTLPGTFSATHEQTFYAVPNVGIVKFTQIDDATVKVPGVVDTVTDLTANGSLVSDVLK